MTRPDHFPDDENGDVDLDEIARRYGGKRAVIRALLSTLALGAAYAASAAQPCATRDHSKVFAPDRKALPPETFDAVRLDMTLWEIIELLGPAQRELGSGLMIFGWESTDGRLFLVGGSSLCKRPLYARFEHGTRSSRHE